MRNVSFLPIVLGLAVMLGCKEPSPSSPSGQLSAEVATIDSTQPPASYSLPKHFSSEVLTSERIAVRIGCGEFMLLPTWDDGGEYARSELSNLAKLTANYVKQIIELDTSRDCRERLAREEDLWFVQRAVLCKKGCADVGSPDEACHIQCLKWAAQCRLDEILARYDSLSTARSAH